MTVFETPSGTKFVDEALDMSLSGDCAAIVPKSLQEDFAARAKARLAERYTEFTETRNGDLANAFDGSPDGGLPKKGWLVFSALASKKLLELAGKERPWRILLVAAPGENVSPLPAIRWWGRLRASDFLFAVEEILGKKGMGYPAWLWHEAICHAICFPDISLVMREIAEGPASPEDFARFLMSHRLYSQETGEMVNALFREPEPSRKEPPGSGAAFELWKLAALDVLADGRTSVHAAALLASGRAREVKQRISASQAATYFPLVSEVHAMITRRLENALGDSWAEMEGDPDNMAHVQEIGPLLAYLMRRLPEAMEEIALAKVWTDIRHCLAHSGIVPARLALKGAVEYRRFRSAYGG